MKKSPRGFGQMREGCLSLLSMATLGGMFANRSLNVGSFQSGVGELQIHWVYHDMSLKREGETNGYAIWRILSAPPASHDPEEEEKLVHASNGTASRLDTTLDGPGIAYEESFW